MRLAATCQTVQILLSLLAILALAAFAWALGFHASPRLDEAGAMAEASAVLPGFRAQSAVLAENGRGALVQAEDGSLAAVLPLADGWVVRRLPARGAVQPVEAGLRLRLDEPMLRSTILRIPSPHPDWLEGHFA